MAKKDEELAACKRNNKNLIEEHSTRAALEKRIKELESRIPVQPTFDSKDAENIVAASAEYIKQLEDALIMGANLCFIPEPLGESDSKLAKFNKKHATLIESIKQKRGKV